MAKKLPISVFVIAKNEADRIGKTILSVKNLADEVIVIDSGSEDDTMAVSEKLGAKVVFHEWEGYGPQKVFGEKLCKHNWILNLDADEEASEKLVHEIKQMFKNKQIPKYPAYRLKIKLLSRFAKKPGLFAPSNNPIRFYNKKQAGFKDSTVHDSVILKDSTETVGQLNNIVIHRCFRSITHAVQKINFYSTMQAEDMLSRKKKPSSIRILFEPLFSFLKAYIIRRYCFFGIDGIVESFIYSFARTIRLAKARELIKELEDKK